MFDDFLERRPGAARDLEDWLNKSATAGPVPDQGQRSAATTPTNCSSTTGNARSPRSWNVGASPDASSKVYEPCPQRRAEDSISINCDPEPHWLLVCARAKDRPTSLTQLDLCCTSSDKELFQELRLSYRSLKSKSTRLFSLKKVQSIRFVQVSNPSRSFKSHTYGSVANVNNQFELHIKDLVDIRKVPDMPSETK